MRIFPTTIALALLAATPALAADAKKTDAPKGEATMINAAEIKWGPAPPDVPAHSLAAGGFHFLPGKMHHAAETKVETVVQIDGMGPFDIHYLNPADNPNKAAAPAKK